MQKFHLTDAQAFNMSCECVMFVTFLLFLSFSLLSCFIIDIVQALKRQTEEEKKMLTLKIEQI